MLDRENNDSAGDVIRKSAKAPLTQKSAIIITSDSLATKHFPGMALHCATNHAVTLFSEALSVELEGRVDVLSW